MLHRAALSVPVLAAALLTAPATAQDGGVAGAGVEPLTTVRVASGLVRPIGAYHAPGDYKRLFIIEKQGRIRILNIKTGVLSPTPFLDVDALAIAGTTNNSEQGLLGLAFHPDYQTNGRFFINYTAVSGSGDTVIAEYTRQTPDLADAGSANIIMTWDQPQSNHNGGWIGFGPDGYLYIGTGDGGNGNDTGTGHTATTGNAQDLTDNLLGKLLRVDVDGDDFPADPNRDYAIPASNPYVGTAGDDEIWDYGLRNPWRCSFDRVTGDLYIADVGQNAWEEVNIELAPNNGRNNYGWRCMEATHCTGLSGCTCGSAGLKLPVHEYSHSVGFCITGGYVYRGCDIPTLDGTYFFADYITNRIWTFDGGPLVTNFTERTSELDPPSFSINSITSFGEDARGEIYICDQGGEVFKVVPVTPTVSPYDLDCSGAVDVADLVEMILEWGSCDGCLADVNGDDNVDVTDLVELILDWG